jgi:hypothetical protein
MRCRCSASVSLNRRGSPGSPAAPPPLPPAAPSRRCRRRILRCMGDSWFPSDIDLLASRKAVDWSCGALTDSPAVASACKNSPSSVSCAAWSCATPLTLPQSPAISLVERAPCACCCHSCCDACPAPPAAVGVTLGLGLSLPRAPAPGTWGILRARRDLVPPAVCCCALSHGAAPPHTRCTPKAEPPLSPRNVTGEAPAQAAQVALPRRNTHYGPPGKSLPRVSEGDALGRGQRSAHSKTSRRAARPFLCAHSPSKALAGALYFQS